MEHNRFVWRATFAASWIVVGLLVFSAISMLFTTPSGAGPVAQLLGPQTAAYFYLMLYSVEATLLATAKILKHHKMIKWVLLVVYLTNFFVSGLQILLNGFTLKLVDNVLLVLLAAGAWLVRTMREDYILVEDLSTLDRH